MHSLTYLATIFAGLASAAAVNKRASKCPRVQIVALGGEGTVVGDLGYLNTTIAAIQDRVVGAQLFQIGYPPGSDSPTAIKSGVPQLMSHLQTFVPKCPDTKIITVGYSAGGAAVMDVLCGAVDTGDGALPRWYRHHIIANIIYGDPTFVGGLDYDRGTCTGSGEVPRVNTDACFPFDKKTRSYCTADDDVCCNGDGPTDLHFQYPGLYDSEVAQFAHAKMGYYVHHKKGHMGSEFMGAKTGGGGM